MKVSRRSLRWLGVAAAAVLVVSTATTASAATPSAFSDPYASAGYNNNVWSYNSPDYGGSGCNNATSTASSSPASPTLAVNGGPSVFTTNVTGSVTSSADNTDVSTATLVSKSTFNVTQSASYPTVMTGTFSGSGQTTLTKSPSVCDVEAQDLGEGDVTVTLNRPGLVTLTATSAGGGTAEASIYNQSSGYSDVTSGLPGTRSTQTVFLPVGTYYLSIMGGTNLGATYPTNVASSESGTASASIRFTPGGARIAGPSGNAGRYVVMGSARNCSLNTLPAHVTGPRYASQIKKVVVLGNGRILKTVYRPAAGRSLTVKLPAKVTETVRINVVLRNGKHLYRTAKYLRCS